jgi:outer membrane protein OmpA-like peptidoglycan-associated protein
MQRLNSLLGAAVVVTLTVLVLPIRPVQGADTEGKWGLGIHGGAYKLGLTDHSDVWTLGWLVNADLKYGVNSKWAIGVEGNWMQTYLADLSEGTKRQDGAGLTTKNVPDGPRQKAYVAGLLAEYRFLPDKKWSPYVSAGPGMYIWKWINKDGNTLVSNEAASAGLSIPSVDKAGHVYELKDQELYVMGGVGLEVFPTDVLSLELGAKFRYLTHLFTSFTDDQDIVGTDPGELDLPKAVGEVYAGLTFYFGGKKYPPPTGTASVNPASGTLPLTVQFHGSASGGRPPLTYAWDFGDGGTSSDQSPSHTYKTVGDYMAALTVTDSKGTTSQSTVSVTVSCPPVEGVAGAEPMTGTVPLSVQFTGSASGGCPPVTYNWDFGDGGTSAEQNPAHTYEKMGDYAVALTITDSKGNTTRKTVSVKATEEFVPTPEKPLVLEGVNFETNKAVLLPDAMQILDRVAASLIAHPDVKVEVGGHCDAVGSDAYNLKLSERRAKAVRDYLAKKGVPAEQLTSKGYGETQPIADNSTPEGRAKNRRVELKRM